MSRERPSQRINENAEMIPGSQDASSAGAQHHHVAGEAPLAGAVSFHFDANEVRTVIREGQVWFVVKDVCRILKISNSRECLRSLDADERSHEKIQNGAINRRMGVVNESGLFALVLTSKKPEARRFRRWITAEVLPAIWHTGTYSQHPAPDPATEHNDITDIINRRTGMYVVVVEAGQRRMWETDGTEIINVAIQGLSRMMAGCLIAAQGALTITQPETLLRDVDTRYALDLLGENIDRGAELARRYLTVNRFHTTESEVPPGELAH